MQNLFLRSAILIFISLVPMIGQGQDRLSDYLETDVAAVVLISNPSQVEEYIRELVNLGDQQWIKAWELACDEEFGFVNSDRLAAIQILFDQLPSLLKQIDELGIVVHDSEFKHVSIILKSKPAVQVELNNWCQATSSHFSNLGEPLETDDDARNAIIAKKSNLFLETVNDWLVVSSNSSCGNEIIERIASGNVNKSLKQSRKYKLVESLLTQGGTREYPIIIYGSPVRLGPLFFPSQTEAVRSAYELDEIPSIGMSISFVPKKEETEKTVLLFDFVATFTQPRSGLAELIDAYEPLGELPTIPFAVLDLYASAYDPLKYYEANKKIIDTANGEGAYEKQLQLASSLIGIDDHKNTIDRADRYLTFRYAPSPEAGIVRVKMEGIRNSEAMKRYIKAEIKRANRNGAGIRRIANEYGEFNSISDKQDVSENQGDIEKKPFSRLFKDHVYFMNHDWFIRGSHYGILSQLESMYLTNQSCEALEAVGKVRKRLDGTASIFMVQFYDLWILNPYFFVEDERIKKKISDPKLQIQNRTKQPNEFGYRLEIESESDCKAVFLSLITNSLSTNLGSIAFACSNEDDKVWVKGMFFPDLKPHEIIK